MSDWAVDWGVLLAICTPFLLSVAILALFGLSAWPRPPKWVRLTAGVLGGGILLFALWAYVLRPLFA